MNSVNQFVVDLRKRVMGLDELHFWDVYTPLVDDVDMIPDWIGAYAFNAAAIGAKQFVVQDFDCS